jgi:hypothetical protein
MKHFSDPDVLALPLELRCCFFVQGWNLDRATPISTVDEWADCIGWMAFYSNLDETSREEDRCLAAQKAKDAVARVISFAESLFPQRQGH